MTDVRDDEEGPQPLVLILLFAAIAVLMVLDMAADLRTERQAGHLVLEAGVAVLAAFGVAVLWRQAFAARAHAARLHADLQTARADAKRWRSEAEDALRGFGLAVDRQFVRWDLTDAERGVALLLLRGLSHKEIATARETSERTVRQQALAVYRKASVHSRGELAAFFLRDLPSSAPRAGEGSP